MAENSTASETTERPPWASGAWTHELQGGRLLIARCEPSDHAFIPTTTRCPVCGSSEWSEMEATGRGSVYSWATVHLSATPTPDMPYTIVDVALEEGPRVYARLVDGVTPEAGLLVAFDPERSQAAGRLVFRPILEAVREKAIRGTVAP